MANELTANDIKIVSIGQPDEAHFDRPAQWFKVVFQIRKNGPTFAIYIGRDIVSDENIIRVARHFLHMQASAIVSATAAWRLTEEEFGKAVAQSTPPNTGPALTSIPQ